MHGTKSMFHRTASAWVASLAIACALAGPARASGAAPDAWLGEYALAKLAETPPGDMPALHAELEQLLLARAACGHFGDLSAVTDLVYAWRAAALLPDAVRVGGNDYALWLRDHRELLRRLLRSLADGGRQREALDRLAELREHDSERTLAYPDLAVAFATCRTAKQRTDEPPPASLTDAFDYYTDSGKRFRYDLSALPYELARYLTITPLSIEEREWAYKRYGRSSKPAKCYFHVDYDYGHYREGRPKRISEHDYTLTNLKEYGGVCVDQAYYAANVCRSLGIPAVEVRGQGRSGIGHAWVAVLEPIRRGRAAAWDSRTGRYEAHLYYTGEIRDPVSGEVIYDSDLALAGMATLLPLERREEADAAVALGRLLQDARKDARQDPVELLRTTAAAWQDARPEATVKIGWIAQADATPDQLSQDLATAAIERNLALGLAWEFVIDLRQDGHIPVKNLYRFLDLLVKHTVKSFPDYSCRIVLRLAPTIEGADERIDFYRAAMRCFGRRPDLAGEILLDVGGLYLDGGKTEKALAAFSEAAVKSIKVSRVVLAATNEAEKILLKTDRSEQAVGMYEQLLKRVRRPRNTTFARYSVHDQLTRRLANLYKELGRAEKAARTMERIK